MVTLASRALVRSHGSCDASYLGGFHDHFRRHSLPQPVLTVWILVAWCMGAVLYHAAVGWAPSHDRGRRTQDPTRFPVSTSVASRSLPLGRAGCHGCRHTPWPVINPCVASVVRVSTSLFQHAVTQWPNPSVKGTSTSGLRPLAAAPYVER
jgi:hypothetical protein